jgi:hypothetical protein
LAENLSKLRRGRWEEDTTGLICWRYERPAYNHNY